MNIYLHSCSDYALSFFQEKILRSLTDQQKRILLIATIAFGFLATCYLISRFCFNARPQPVSPLKNLNTEQEGLNKADETIPASPLNDEKQDVTPEDKEKNFALHESLNLPPTEEEQDLPSRNDSNEIGEDDLPDNLVNNNEKTTQENVEETDLHQEGSPLPPPLLLSDKDGVLNGKGKRIYSSTEEAEGEFKNGHLHGLGKASRSDGIQEEGAFQNGYLEGEGTRIYSDGKIEQGTFNGDILIEGKIIYPLDAKTAKKLEGKKEEAKKDPYFGRRIDEGKFKNGFLYGQGKRIYATGKVDKGEFDFGILINGKSTFANGTVWEGNFKYFRLHGEGKKFFSDGETEEGTYENGKLVKSKSK